MRRETSTFPSLVLVQSRRFSPSTIPIPFHRSDSDVLNLPEAASPNGARSGCVLPQFSVLFSTKAVMWTSWVLHAIAFNAAKKAGSR